MQSVQVAVRNALLRIKVARSMSGDSHGGFYGKISSGLMVKPIKISARAAAIPAHEIEAIDAARIAGKSEDDIRKLVQRLHAQRVVGA